MKNLMKNLKIIGEFDKDNLVFTVKIPKLYLEECEGKILTFKTLFKYKNKSITFKSTKLFYPLF